MQPVSVPPLALAMRAMIEAVLNRYNLPASEAAIRLLLMIAAHESGGFMYTRQKRGPALGLFQMEPPTFEHVCDYIRRRAARFAMLPSHYPPERMITHPEYAAALARVYLLTKPEPLPAADDLPALASYAKRHWNTELGKATPEQYLDAYKHYVLGES